MRAQIDLALDGELSHFETAMMASHLERCPGCRAYRIEVSGFTEALRATPLEVMERPITVGRRRRTAGTPLRAVAAVAVVAVAAFTGIGQFGQFGQFGHLTGDGNLRPSVFLPPNHARAKPPTQNDLEREQAMLARARVGEPVQLKGEAL